MIVQLTDTFAVNLDHVVRVTVRDYTRTITMVNSLRSELTCSNSEELAKVMSLLLGDEL